MNRMTSMPPPLIAVERATAASRVAQSFTIGAGPSTLVVGGDFTRLGGVAQQMFGMFKE